jgi:predicted HTH transcriptional regulator
MSDVPFLELPSRLATDALPVRETSTTQIDMDAVAAHIQEASTRERYDGPQEPMAYLRSRRAIVAIGGTDYLTLTGLLCFGHVPQELFPHAVIDLGHYSGRESVSHEVIHLEKDINGNIFQQLNRLENYLWQNTHHGMTLSPTSLQRVEIHEYPRAVIRELGVNMVAHRDYAIYAARSRVQLFRNRIEWISPGGLPPGLTIENILTEQRPRNPHIMRVLYEAGYVEAFGQGLDTVVAELRREQMPPPEFKDTGASFIVTVYGRTRAAMRASDEQSIELSDAQGVILTFIRAKGSVAPREIRDLFPDRAERSLQRDIKFLTESGLILAQGGSRALRYVAREPDE